MDKEASECACAQLDMGFCAIGISGATAGLSAANLAALLKDTLRLPSSILCFEAIAVLIGPAYTLPNSLLDPVNAPTVTIITFYPTQVFTCLSFPLDLELIEG